MNCLFCAQPLRPGDKVLQVYRLAGGFQYGVPLAVGDPEGAHVACTDPARAFAHEVVPPRRLVAYNPGMTVRVAPSHQCLFCGETFRREDRVVEVIRVQGVSEDPVRGAKGVVCDDDREYAHARCDDRDATKGTHRTRVVLA